MVIKVGLLYEYVRQSFYVNYKEMRYIIEKSMEIYLKKCYSLKWCEILRKNRDKMK